MQPRTTLQADIRWWENNDTIGEVTETFISHPEEARSAVSKDGPPAFAAHVSRRTWPSSPR
ncbi:hypothetical protein [Roseibium sp. MMSF_3544]|uniref:hypothetical protein n=1 Tax=unclassified Roseibium TaxID=2629323 RepID=UPI00273E3846|nr:hypothetical protein [Roseibium sp. MMSF_3544]